MLSVKRLSIILLYISTVSAVPQERGGAQRNLRDVQVPRRAVGARNARARLRAAAAG